MTSVLVTDITSYKAVVTVRHLRRHYPQIRVVATDHRPFARTIRTRFASGIHVLRRKPETGEPYARALADIVAGEGIDILLPVNSKEIRALVSHRALFGRALDYMGDSALYGRLDDKAQFAALLDQAGLPQPRAYSTLDAPLPLVVKPRRGSSAKGVTYLTSEAQRSAFVAAHGATTDDLVIQEYVEGEGIGYSGFFDSGKPLVTYAHRRVAEYPVSGGSSVVRERYPYGDLPELAALVGKLLNSAPWSGFAMFELKRRGPGDFVFIECNPRIWGSIHQGLADGADYFAPLFGVAPAPPSVPARPLRTSLLPLNLLAALGYARSGRARKLGEMFLPIFRNRADINPITDPLGFLALLLRGA